jgi:excisionase family DNA binding protein
VSGQAADTRGEVVPAAVGTWPVEHGLTAKEAARVAGVHERTIRRAIARGELAATKRARLFQIAPGALARYQARRQPSLPPPSQLRLVEHPPGPTVVLPAPLTSFLGREQDIAAIRQLLSTARLVTLTGPGGVGKTRLAIAIAHDVADHFDDGVAWVDLAQLSDAALVPASVAAALAITIAADRSIVDTLAATLRNSNRLLLLDNCDHVLT